MVFVMTSRGRKLWGKRGSVAANGPGLGVIGVNGGQGKSQWAVGNPAWPAIRPPKSNSADLESLWPHVRIRKIAARSRICTPGQTERNMLWRCRSITTPTTPQRSDRQRFDRHPRGSEAELNGSSIADEAPWTIPSHRRARRVLGRTPSFPERLDR